MIYIGCIFVSHQKTWFELLGSNRFIKVYDLFNIWNSIFVCFLPTISISKKLYQNPKKTIVLYQKLYQKVVFFGSIHHRLPLPCHPPVTVRQETKTPLGPSTPPGTAIRACAPFLWDGSLCSFLKKWYGLYIKKWMFFLYFNVNMTFVTIGIHSLLLVANVFYMIRMCVMVAGDEYSWDVGTFRHVSDAF